MIEIMKRYAVALIFLFLVVFLMIIGTIGVKIFGDKMLEDTNMVMQPRGERIN